MAERREERLIERSAGKGSIWRAGVSLGTVSYVLEAWQTFHIVQGFGSGPAQEVEGLKELRVRLVRHNLDFKLMQESATITLHLEDGRHVDGFLDGERFIASSQLTAA